MTADEMERRIRRRFGTKTPLAALLHELAHHVTLGNALRDLPASVDDTLGVPLGSVSFAISARVEPHGKTTDRAPRLRLYHRDVSAVAVHYIVEPRSASHFCASLALDFRDVLGSHPLTRASSDVNARMGRPVIQRYAARLARWIERLPPCP